MARLQDRVIIVTVGAHGIGRAYCEGLAREGARVVVADLDAEGAEAVVKAVGTAGKDALAVLADVSQPEATERMARAAVERFGRIDGLINNAAFFQRPAISAARPGPCPEAHRGATGPGGHGRLLMLRGERLHDRADPGGGRRGADALRLFVADTGRRP
jgi:NAD(P)-dependent dehydrogenase (short-subunit alcohol dehydrogenase family)